MYKMRGSGRSLGFQMGLNEIQLKLYATLYIILAPTVDPKYKAHKKYSEAQYIAQKKN